MNTKPHLLGLLRTSLLFLLFACGPASNLVTVRLQTGLEYSHPTKNLMQGLVQLGFVKAGTCSQRNVLVGVDSNPGTGGLASLTTFPVGMSTAYDTTPYTIDSAWMSSYASISPIEVQIPRGHRTAVGVVGALAAGILVDPAGNCQDRNVGFTPYDSTSLIGHKTIDTATDTVIPLNLWVLPANATPSPTPVTGDPVCAADTNDNQSCPTVDFFNVTCASCGSSSWHLRLEYGFATNRSSHIIQWIPSSRLTSGAAVSVPALKPMKITVVNTSGVDLGSYQITKSDFVNNIASPSITLTTGGPAVVNVLERPHVLPNIGNFSITSFVDNGTGSLNVNWTTANLADNYTLQYSTDSGTTYSTIISTPSTSYAGTSTLNIYGTTYLINVKATSSAGAIPFTTAPITYVPIGPISPPPTATQAGGAGTPVTVNWTLPAGASGDFHTIIQATLGGMVVQQGTVNGAVSTFTFTGLGAGSYIFKLQVNNSYSGMRTVQSSPFTVQ